MFVVFCGEDVGHIAEKFAQRGTDDILLVMALRVLNGETPFVVHYSDDDGDAEPFRRQRWMRQRA